MESTSNNREWFILHQLLRSQLLLVEWISHYRNWLPFTVKLTRANLPAMAAGKLFRRWNYPRMQAKISAGTDCMRFPRVTGGKLPATSGNSHEVFIVRVRADFFKPRDVSFNPVPNTSTKVTTCCLWSQWRTLQIWFCSKKNGLFLAGSSNRYTKKNFFGFLTHTKCWKDNQQK